MDCKKLQDFLQTIEQFILSSGYALELSGVAEVVEDESNVYSSSFIVNDQSTFPTPHYNNLLEAKKLFQEILPTDCTFQHVVVIRFITRDGTLGSRWQVHYRFRN